MPSRISAVVVLTAPSTPTKVGRGPSARRRDPRGRRGAGRPEDYIVRAQDRESTMTESRNNPAAVTSTPTPEFSPTEVMAFLTKVDAKLTEVRDLLVERRTVKE